LKEERALAARARSRFLAKLGMESKKSKSNSKGKSSSFAALRMTMVRVSEVLWQAV
jgi:hypothetical protein